MNEQSSAITPWHLSQEKLRCKINAKPNATIPTYDYMKEKVDRYIRIYQDRVNNAQNWSPWSIFNFITNSNEKLREFKLDDRHFQKRTYFSMAYRKGQISLIGLWIKYPAG